MSSHSSWPTRITTPMTISFSYESVGEEDFIRFKVTSVYTTNDKLIPAARSGLSTLLPLDASADHVATALLTTMAQLQDHIHRRSVEREQKDE